MEAKFLSIGSKDLIKGAIMALITAVLTGLYNCITNEHLPCTWDDFKPILIVGFGSAISYLLKNFFTNSEDKFATKEDSGLKLKE